MALESILNCIHCQSIRSKGKAFNVTSLPSKFHLNFYCLSIKTLKCLLDGITDMFQMSCLMICDELVTCQSEILEIIEKELQESNASNHMNIISNERLLDKTSQLISKLYSNLPKEGSILMTSSSISDIQENWKVLEDLLTRHKQSMSNTSTSDMSIVQDQRQSNEFIHQIDDYLDHMEVLVELLRRCHINHSKACYNLLSHYLHISLEAANGLKLLKKYNSLHMNEMIYISQFYQECSNLSNLIANADHSLQLSLSLEKYVFYIT